MPKHKHRPEIEHRLQYLERFLLEHFVDKQPVQRDEVFKRFKSSLAEQDWGKKLAAGYKMFSFQADLTELKQKRIPQHELTIEGKEVALVRVESFEIKDRKRNRPEVKAKLGRVLWELLFDHKSKDAKIRTQETIHPEHERKLDVIRSRTNIRAILDAGSR